MDRNIFDCFFRPATKVDYFELHALLHNAWMEIYPNFVSPRSVERFVKEDGVGEHLKLYLSSMTVAVIDGKIVGVINQFDEVVTALAVSKVYRRNRIGSCLLHNASVEGGNCLDVPVFNEGAIAFYRSNGWKIDMRFDQDVFGTVVESFLMIKPVPLVH